MNPGKIEALEDQLGHKFKDINKIYRALTHPTFSKEERERKVGSREYPDQATYATLGDAILKAGFVLLLMEKGLNTKGEITITKSEWENNLKLAEVGKRLRLMENELIFHRMGKGEGTDKGKETMCADTVEALIGAIFLDSDSCLRSTNYCIEKIFFSELEDMKNKQHS
jgi:ribonuclease III